MQEGQQCRIKKGYELWRMWHDNIRPRLKDGNMVTAQFENPQGWWVRCGEIYGYVPVQFLELAAKDGN